jgi:transcription antitermination factor NusG
MSKDIEVFTPTIAVVRSWKDRRMKLHVPAFPGYVFAKSCLSERGRIISVPGVVKILSFNGAPAQLDEAEIENIRLCQRRGALMESRSLFEVGERVRVRSGPLKGLEGFISRCKDERRLIVPLTHINQSLAVQVDVGLLEPLGNTPET